MPEKPRETGSCEVEPHKFLPAAAEISPFECAACDETWPPSDLNLAAHSRNLVLEEREHVLNRPPQNQRSRHQAPRKVATAGGAR